MTRARTTWPAGLAFFLLLGNSLPLAAASLSAVITDNNGEPVDDAVFYVETVDGRTPDYTPRQKAEIDQIDRTYVPHVRAVTAGTSVEFPNSDDVQHHVYSFSEAKTFEIPLYRDTPPEPVVFDTPGIAVLGCNIHDHMRAYVVVLETPYFAEAGEGRADIPDVPGGELVVKLWHPRMADAEEITRVVTLMPEEDRVLEYTLDLRPALRTRRAPRPGGRDY